MIGIIGAMDVEIEKIKSAVENPVCVERAGMEFARGMLGGKEVCAAVCAPGKVNAAICAQIMIDRFGAEAIINTGIGCSLADGVGINDTVIASDVCQYDCDTTAFGDPPGLINGLNIVKIPTDAALSDALAEAAERRGARVHRGTVASGDAFIADAAKKERIANAFGAVCGEMEGGATGHVCYANGVPFAVLRTVSDGGDSAALIDYPTFKKIAAENSAAIIIDCIKGFS